MLLTRRRALLGMFAAPAIIKTAGLLMPVRPVVVEPPIAMGSLVEFSGFNFQAAKIMLEAMTPEGDREYWVTAEQMRELGEARPGEPVVVARLPAGSTIKRIYHTVFDASAVMPLIGRARD
jgi:hypothetical protein